MTIKMLKKGFKLPYLAVVAAPLLLFAGKILRGQALFWGTPSLQFIPWWEWSWELFRAGEIPLWNRWVGMGAPLAANYQTALFYPPHWLYLVLDSLGGASWMAWGTTLMVPLHLIGTGLGMVFLIKELGGKRLAQTVGSLSFALSGYLVARAGFLSINATAAWLPWILVATLRLARKPSWDRISQLGLLWGGQFLAGHAQTAWYTVLLAAAWMTFASWAHRGRVNQRVGRELGTRGAAFILAGMMGAALAAVQLLPTLQYLAVSQRAQAVDYTLAMTYSFWPWRLLTLLTPDLFGSPAQGNYWGYGNYWEDAVYLGLLPLVLAFRVLIRSVREKGKRNTPASREEGIQHRHLVLFNWMIVIVSFVFALGKNLPLFPFFYRHIPSFDLFQAPTRMTLWAECSLALLAGLGVEKISPPEGRGLYWNRLAVAGSAALALGAGLAWYFFEGIEVSFIRAVSLLGVWAAGSALLLLIQPGEQSPQRKQMWGWGIVILISADLLTAAWGHNPGIEAEYYRVNELNGPGKDRYYLSTEGEYELKFNRFFRFEDYQTEGEWEQLKDSLLPNLNILERVEMANNFDPLVPGRYQVWMETLEKAEPPVKQQMLRLMNVNTQIFVDDRWEVTYQRIEGDPASELSFSSCPRYVQSGGEALQLILGEKIKLDREIIIESAGDKLNGCWPAQAQLRILDQGPQELRLEVSADQPGWVFWSQTHYPGWKAQVDGEDVEIRRANYLFQAVPVTEGTHQVQFRFQSQVFRMGWVMTVVMGMGLAGRWVWKRNKQTG